MDTFFLELISILDETLEDGEHLGSRIMASCMDDGVGSLEAGS